MTPTDLGLDTDTSAAADQGLTTDPNPNTPAWGPDSPGAAAQPDPGDTLRQGATQAVLTELLAPGGLRGYADPDAARTTKAALAAHNAYQDFQSQAATTEQQYTPDINAAAHLGAFHGLTSKINEVHSSVDQLAQQAFDKFNQFAGSVETQSSNAPSTDATDSSTPDESRAGFNQQPTDQSAQPVPGGGEADTADHNVDPNTAPVPGGGEADTQDHNAQGPAQQQSNIHNDVDETDSLTNNGTYFSDPNFNQNLSRYADAINAQLPGMGDIAAAQARLETGNGQKMSTTFNYGNVGNTDSDPKGGGAYRNPEEAAAAYVAFIKGNGAPQTRYQNIIDAAGKGADIPTLASMFQQDGYATDPDYAKKISAAAAPTPQSHDNPNVATATNAALQAGAPPAAVTWAQAHLGEQDFIGLCEKFTELATQGHAGIAPSAIAAWQQASKPDASGSVAAHTDLANIRPGDAVYFDADGSNDHFGHTGVYIGNGQFISATDNGVKQYSIGDWEKLTGQKLLGYVPGSGSAALPPSPPKDDRNPFQKAAGVVQQGLSAVGNAASATGATAQNAFGFLAPGEQAVKDEFGTLRNKAGEVVQAATADIGDAAKAVKSVGGDIADKAGATARTAFPETPLGQTLGGPAGTVADVAGAGASGVGTVLDAVFNKGTAFIRGALPDEQTRLTTPTGDYQLLKLYGNMPYEQAKAQYEADAANAKAQYGITADPFPTEDKFEQLKTGQQAANAPVDTSGSVVQTAQNIISRGQVRQEVADPISNLLASFANPASWVGPGEVLNAIRTAVGVVRGAEVVDKALPLAEQIGQAKNVISGLRDAVTSADPLAAAKALDPAATEGLTAEQMTRAQQALHILDHPMAGASEDDSGAFAESGSEAQTKFVKEAVQPTAPQMSATPTSEAEFAGAQAKSDMKTAVQQASAQTPGTLDVVGHEQTLAEAKQLLADGKGDAIIAKVKAGVEPTTPAERVAINLQHSDAIEKVYALANGSDEELGQAYLNARAMDDVAQQAQKLAGRVVEASKIERPEDTLVQTLKDAKNLDAVRKALLASKAAPFDVKAHVINYLAQTIGGTSGAVYGATQDPNDDAWHKAIKAVLYGAAGASAGHVGFGGSFGNKASGVGERFVDTYINNLLTAGTPIAKGANDFQNAVLGPVMRTTAAIAKVDPQGALAAVRGGFSGAVAIPDAIKAALHEFNPAYTTQWEHLGEDVKRAPVMASPGQVVSSGMQRTINATTEFWRTIMTAQVTKELQLADKFDPTVVKDTVDKMLLLNKPEGLGKWSYGVSNSVGNIPGVGRILVPFRKIPANLLQQVVEWTPGVGMLATLGKNADRTGIVVKQLTATGAVALMDSQFGPEINGAGPSNPAAYKQWREAGNTPWTVNVPLLGWVPMSHMPPPMQATLRFTGALNDYQQYGGDMPEVVAHEFGSTLTDLNFLPSLLQTVLKMSGNVVSGTALGNQINQTATQTLGSVVPSYLAAGARGMQTAKTDLKADAGDFSKLLADTFKSRLPGLQGDIPTQIGATSSNNRPGLKAVLGSVAPQEGPQSDVSSRLAAEQTQVAATAQHLTDYWVNQINNDPQLRNDPQWRAMTSDEQKAYLKPRITTQLETNHFGGNPTEILNHAQKALLQQHPDFSPKAQQYYLDQVRQALLDYKGPNQ